MSDFPLDVIVFAQFSKIGIIRVQGAITKQTKWE